MSITTNPHTLIIKVYCLLPPIGSNGEVTSVTPFLCRSHKYVINAQVYNANSVSPTLQLHMGHRWPTPFQTKLLCFHNSCLHFSQSWLKPHDQVSECERSELHFLKFLVALFQFSNTCAHA